MRACGTREKVDADRVGHGNEGVVKCVYVCLHVMDEGQGMRQLWRNGAGVHRQGVSGAGKGVGGRGEHTHTDVHVCSRQTCMCLRARVG